MNKTEVFDLGSVSVVDVAKLAVRHPQTTAPTGWIIDIAGPGHPETIALGNETARERLVQQREQEQARVNGKKWKGGDVDPDSERDRNLSRIARRILGWTPVTLNGEAFAYSPANAILLLKEPAYTWAATQVYEFLGEDASFIKTSAPI